MSTLAMIRPASMKISSIAIKTKRLESIDFLRGVVMIIMALDHVRDYFHYDAFFYSPTDLEHTSVILFFTRFITHYCAPVFVFLSGISAYLYGTKKSKRELTGYLFTRGIWLVFVELFIISLGRTFNPSYPFFNLQVIWAIGISMIVLSLIIYMNRRLIFLTGSLLLAAHNLLDGVHAPGNFFWHILHEPGEFLIGRITIAVHYPVIPWIGIIILGYYFGSFYHYRYDPEKRRKTFLCAGITSIVLFIILRAGNFYGDAAHWSIQKNVVFNFLSLLNVTKYPPSFLYILITLGPALIFLALCEKPLTGFTKKIAVFGRVPFFYYVAHIYLIHLLAMIGALICGYNLSDMILTSRVNSAPELKGYGFNLTTVYFVWMSLVILLYPCCKWFDRYKRTHQSAWLSYL